VKRTLIIGYGNLDRQDDGVAWHILGRTARLVGFAGPFHPEEGLESVVVGLDFLFQLQLTPELAEMLTDYERVCFVDAHTGVVPQDVHWVTLEAEFQRSPLTHHFTPNSCLALCKEVYHHQPEAALVSVRGYWFGFTQELSEETTELAGQAAQMIVDWL